MKTAIKLNKKELFSLYEKSSDIVKKNLCMEFGEAFFIQAEVKPETIIPTVRNPKSPSKNKRSSIIDWEMIFDFSPVLRIAIYACLLLMIFSQ